MNNATKTIQITVTEDTQDPHRIDTTVIHNLVSKASEIVEAMLQTNSMSTQTQENEDMLCEVSHLLFDALLQLSPSGELTSFPRKI